MESLVGLVLAASVGLFASFVGLDRDRAFYPTVMVVIASYYILFAVMGGSAVALVAESLVCCAFLVLAVVGFKRTLWLVVVALAAHGVFDFVHGGVISNSGVPAWWPGFCLAYDVVAAAYLAWLLSRRRLDAGANRPGAPADVPRAVIVASESPARRGPPLRSASARPETSMPRLVAMDATATPCRPRPWNGPPGTPPMEVGLTSRGNVTRTESSRAYADPTSCP